MKSREVEGSYTQKTLPGMSSRKVIPTDPPYRAFRLALQSPREGGGRIEIPGSSPEYWPAVQSRAQESTSCQWVSNQVGKAL